MTRERQLGAKTVKESGRLGWQSTGCRAKHRNRQLAGDTKDCRANTATGNQPHNKLCEKC
ncbi:MAG: hypothetical protein J6Z22_05335 [Lachnospiraceae bacterium]|nr:hypothetical protein [Lachnospiraceae bacterium]